MKAIFEVKFKIKDMCDKKTLKEDFNGSWLKVIKYLYKEEGMGIFNNELKLIKVIK